MSAVINIAGFSGKSSTGLRVLGVKVDSKLKWGLHINLTYKRACQQIASLTRLVGPSFAQAKHIYTAVVLPKMTYACSVWSSPQRITSFTGKRDTGK